MLVTLRVVIWTNSRKGEAAAGRENAPCRQCGQYDLTGSYPFTNNLSKDSPAVSVSLSVSTSSTVTRLTHER
jgi:hypothetical protein